MEGKPNQASGYSPTAVQLAHAASVYIATKLGDLRDDLVIVGGLVPGLIIPQFALPAGCVSHIGTMDVDLGLSIAILDEQRYHELCERLRNAGFEPDTNEAGHATNQRWRIESKGRNITVDFLIQPTMPGDKGGRLRNLEEGFSAVITPGLELAFQDRRLVTLSGETLHHETASREAWVCDAGAFTVLKALAFDGRGENKDAYDLMYLLQNYGSGIADVFRHLQPLLRNPSASHALTILDRDFSGVDAIGVVRFAEFLGNREDEAMRADAAGAVRSLLAMCQRAL